MGRDTGELIQDFAEKGEENGDFDAKSREVLESSEGRKKLVKRVTGFANAGGGTIIVGVRRQDGDILLQGIDPDTEARKQLTDIARRYSDPRLTELWEIQIVEHSGVKLLRIDVDSPRTRPVSFLKDGEPEMFIRIEDTTQGMSKQEVAEFVAERRKEEEDDLYWDGKVLASVSVDEELENSEIVRFNSREERSITSITDHGLVVFSGSVGIDPFGSNLLFHLESDVGISDAQDLEQIFRLAEQHLDARLQDYDLGYTVALGSRQLHGRGIQNLIEDVNNPHRMIDELVAAHESGPKLEHSLTGEPRPVVVVQTTTNRGSLWVEFQWRNEGWTRGSCGIILPNLPFNDSSLKEFFGEVGSKPRYYEQKGGTQMLRLHGPQQELGHPEVSTVTPEYTDIPLHSIADNPIYDKKEELAESVEEPLPEYILDPVVATSRIPFQIKGGYNKKDYAFWSDSIEMLYLPLMHRTIIVDALCRPPIHDEEKIEM